MRSAALFFAGIIAPGGAERALAFANLKREMTAEGGTEFIFAQLAYEGGNWDPFPSSWETLQNALESSTSIVARKERQILRADSQELFSHPFIFMAGEKSFKLLSEDNVDMMRKYFKSGGTLFADDGAAAPGLGFDVSFRREMKRIFPEEPLQRIPLDHTIYKSFYLIRGMGGRKIVSPFMEGISLGGRTQVIYSPNGLSAAWARDQYGRWLHATEHGGERQRKLALQLGINIIMYALCSDYKQDRIHLPFLRRKI